MSFFLIIAVIVGVVLLIIYSYYTAEQRRKAMVQIADQLGLAYLEKKASGKDLVYHNISLFQQGHSRQAFNVIGGTKEQSYIDIFDYKYVTGSGKNQSTWYRSVCILTVPQRFKYLYVRIESFLDKIAAAVGFDDIDFESKEFSSHFYVKSDDKKFAYDIVHPQMMDFLLNYRRIYQVAPCIEMNGKYLVFYYPNKIKPEKYIDLYNFASDFYKKIPNYVLEQYASV